ncbi:hypothetical protein BDN70DRAFT_937906 [Pholiota conissans]|uniref:Uncharacterized protein n=1 Tax=Pholiota conissans TaxID=109636 RepID=A0A9P6CMX3_9AGAR|nr:hypothetical protein BDN70DRAFT_937906 [Pholiota conissans]
MDRIREERKQITSPRMTEIRSHFLHTTKILLTHRARREYIHPYGEAVYKIKFFSEYIDNPDNSFVPLDFNAAQQEIRRFLEGKLTAKKHSLFIILLEKGFLPQEVKRYSEPDQYLELAIAVFQCLLCCQAFVGWEDAFAHVHTEGKGDKWSVHESFDFCESGYQALQIMVDGLRLGPDSLLNLTHSDLDILNRRFVCKTCRLMKKGGTYSLPSLTWRECLYHALEANDPLSKTQHTPVFDVLTEALTTHLLACEEPFPPPSARVWGCLHCVLDGGPLKKARAIQHNHEVHHIANPIENTDFSFIHTYQFPKRKQFLIKLTANGTSRCLRCAPGTYKLWVNKNHDLYRHLWDKHHIKSIDLIEGIDWEIVKAVENDSWILEATKEG